MRLLSKIVIAALIAAAFGIGAVAATGAVDNPQQRTSPAVDISGPCDEAENANDPRCTGARALEDNDNDDDGVVGEDISGPCDEAEHANDPRCTGANVDDDNSGPGSHGDDGDDDHGDNSGPGSHGDDGDDDHGDDGDDDHGDDHGDNSGPGGGGDDDSSGPGSGDDN